MTAGYLPFDDPNTGRLYKKILNCDLRYPSFFSENLKDLISKLLTVDPLERISISDIRSHKWYKIDKPIERAGINIDKEAIPVVQ